MTPALAAASLLLSAAAAGAATPTPTPGPAARAGATVDQTWSSVSGSVSEALLITRVRVALLERLGDDGLRVTINSRQGAVELSGQVEKQENVELAGRVARTVDGVRTVTNGVTAAAEGQLLEPPVARTMSKVEHGVADALLETHVKMRLIGELGTVAFKIGVTASRGVVTLSGTVPDAERRRVAVRIAGATTDVKEVRDQLALQ